MKVNNWSVTKMNESRPYTNKQTNTGYLNTKRGCLAKPLSNE